MWSRSNSNELANCKGTILGPLTLTNSGPKLSQEIFWSSPNLSGRLSYRKTQICCSTNLNMVFHMTIIFINKNDLLHGRHNAEHVYMHYIVYSAYLGVLPILKTKKKNMLLTFGRLSQCQQAIGGGVGIEFR